MGSEDEEEGDERSLASSDNAGDAPVIIVQGEGRYHWVDRGRGRRKGGEGQEEGQGHDGEEEGDERSLASSDNAGDAPVIIVQGEGRSS